ncbi:MAG: sugar ABC transporter substrate-binding protein [Pseudonocardiaceae bacterium]
MRTWAATATAALTIMVSACGSAGADRDGGASVEQGFPIGILLPESKTSRYETFDRPLITQRLNELCPNCQVRYRNADQNSAEQQNQAEALILSGARVLILDPVDSTAAGAIVTSAKSQGVAVVAYDRLASGPIDYYVSYRNERVGQVQGTALLTALKAGGDPRRGQIVMINGSPTDPNAGDFKRGAHSVLDGQAMIGQEYDTPDWSPDRAQQEMEQAITALGREAIIGVYAANDGTAAGAIAALKGAGFTTLPPVTGQDAELAGIQRILAGEQYMTVYKAIKPEATIAAEMAIAAATGADYRGRPTQLVSNGSVDVPSVLLEPVPVTRENVASTIIADGFHPAEQVCTTEYRQACQRAGIS